jgi:DNA topoisomerase-2
MAERRSSDYVKLTQLEHVRLRPDRYLGSVKPCTASLFALSTAEPVVIERRSIEGFVPGLLKIFDEVLVIAIDQSHADETLTTIKVCIDGDSGRVTIVNDDMGIPVEKHPQYPELYTPEVIFSELLTSSNFDDSKERITGGRNALGVKLTNIFSQLFELEVVDTVRGVKLKQAWKQMVPKGAAKISRLSEKSSAKGSVKVSFVPDFGYFGVTCFGEDFLQFLRKRAYDAAVCVRPGVKVALDGTRVPIKRFSDYVAMYLGDKSVPRVEIDLDRWKVVVARSREDRGFQQVSFVNGVSTSGGGTHVEHVLWQLVRKVSDVLNVKAVSRMANALRNGLFVFISATLVNPTFDSQTKVRNLCLLALARDQVSGGPVDRQGLSQLYGIHGNDVFDLKRPQLHPRQSRHLSHMIAHGLGVHGSRPKRTLLYQLPLESFLRTVLRQEFGSHLARWCTSRGEERPK